MVALGHPSTFAVLFRQLEGRLEEVHEQTRGAVQSRNGLSGSNTSETAVGEELAHHSAILLLDPSLVVLAVGQLRVGDPVKEVLDIAFGLRELGFQRGFRRLCRRKPGAQKPSNTARADGGEASGQYREPDEGDRSGSRRKDLCGRRGQA
jgi:hypothetical protein